MRWVCVVIMWNLQIRIEKSFSYSISYSYSNLKVPNERKKTLTAKMRRSPAIFSVYMPSDYATTSSNVTPGPRGCKFVHGM